MGYEAFKVMHLLGLVLLLGNVTVTSIWKLYADRTRDPRIIAFAQRLVTVTDWFFTFWGIVLLVAGGYGAAWVAGIDPFGAGWLVWSQVQFAVAGVMWLGLLVPIQIRQARLARGIAETGRVPDEYWALSRRWIIWGLVATLPLVGATWTMVAKS
ncbi:DUF2269 family protein [Paracraurococcus ruber]|uniref:DUF2269 domain-containing protein n=1 Tax=Paracraurococcus ruber TaxID=77675 RepID=A0ABS1CXG6_9PROT|nr:DUF2269 family protein [Paracraurococcus ruber]MBK1659228.1 hypothetical protein [Paracraurococcus ruber]TDG29829.1 DUF2269 family protein [Paracraurococcus ruber]